MIVLKKRVMQINRIIFALKLPKNRGIDRGVLLISQQK